MTLLCHLFVLNHLNKGNTMSGSVENIIIEEHQLFGNGHPMKFFNFLFKTFVFFFILGTLMDISTLAKTFVNDYKSNSELFFSIWGNMATIFFLLLIVVYNLVTTKAIIDKDKQKFSVLILWRYPISSVFLISNYLLYVHQYPVLGQLLLPQTIIQIAIQLSFFAPIYIYLKKRMNKKYPKDINQDLFQQH
jgi:hypothetical protein